MGANNFSRVQLCILSCKLNYNIFYTLTCICPVSVFMPGTLYTAFRRLETCVGFNGFHVNSFIMVNAYLHCCFYKINISLMFLGLSPCIKNKFLGCNKAHRSVSLKLCRRRCCNFQELSITTILLVNCAIEVNMYVIY